MAKANYAFARRQRELAKKQKQEEKRRRRGGGGDDVQTAEPAPTPVPATPKDVTPGG
ncbi:MAG TPA: hypothetical protein VFB01_06990 [Burkholderiales bacterium]|nr:hypothetical protein [Burkholderiales bacterium]